MHPASPREHDKPAPVPQISLCERNVERPITTANRVQVHTPTYFDREGVIPGGDLCSSDGHPWLRPLMFRYAHLFRVTTVA